MFVQHKLAHPSDLGGCQFMCWFFFLPLVNNAVTYAQSHLYFHCLSLLTKGLGTGLVPLGTAGTLVLVMDAASSSAQFGNQSSL